MTRCPRLATGALAVAMVLVGAAALGGCGQTGPLYLPHPKPKPAKPAPAPASAPAPQTTPTPAPASR